jgi:hypothetical protein
MLQRAMYGKGRHIYKLQMYKQIPIIYCWNNVDTLLNTIKNS